MFVTHTDDLDSFGLLVKSAMLLSKVKHFNTRYRMKRHLNDPDYTPRCTSDTAMAIMSVPAFVELDQLNFAFLESLPPRFKNPLINGSIDIALLAAISNAHL